MVVLQTQFTETQNSQFSASEHFNSKMVNEYECRIRQFCSGYDSLHQMLASLLHTLPEKAIFLSAGAGTGTEIIHLATQFSSWQFVAVDVSKDMIQACKVRAINADVADRVTFVHGRLEECQSDMRFDAASSIFVAHFIRERDKKLAYFRAVADTLKPGGIFVFADLFGNRQSPDFLQLFNVWLQFYAMQGIIPEQLEVDRFHIENDIDFISEQEVFSIVCEAGFETPVRFYQNYLFGGWATRKCTNA